MSEGQKRLVYITGSITGASDAELQLFHDAANELRERGYRVFNPPEHDVPDASVKEDAWNYALCRDIAVITHCYGIATLPTFLWSKGALFEVFVALSLSKEIVLLRDQGDAWKQMIITDMKDVKSLLWKNVDRPKYTHHTDLSGDSTS
jgi:hypothetical protein